MKLSSKPSIWVVLALTALLILLVRQRRNYPPPTHVGKLWINHLEGGFNISFQLVDQQGHSVPSSGRLHIRIDQKLYEVGNEIGATFQQTYNFAVNDFQESIVHQGEHELRYYTATTEKISYQDFKPPSEKGVICRLSFLFLDDGKYEDYEIFVKTKKVVI